MHALYREFYSLVYIYFWFRPTPAIQSIVSSAFFIDHRLDYTSFETHDGYTALKRCLIRAHLRRTTTSRLTTIRDGIVGHQRDQLLRSYFTLSMETKHVIDGLQVPSGAPLPKLMPRPPHLTCAVVSKKDSYSHLQIPRRKTEQVKSPTSIHSGRQNS